MRSRFVNRFYIDGELDDPEIITALLDAADMYANGEIIETRDMLAEVIRAIDRFTCEYKGGELNAY